MLKLYYNFFTKFCDVNKIEELVMDTDSLNLALAGKKLEDESRKNREVIGRELSRAFFPQYFEV